MQVRIGVTAAAAAMALVVGLPTGAMAAQPADEVFQPLSTANGEPVEPEKLDAEPASDGDPADLPMTDREREAAHAQGSRAATDLRGWRPSLYTGKWFMPGKEDVRKCILDRESNFNYQSTSGVYHGAYQMSAPLGRGATWMMQAEVRREMGAEGVAIVQALRKLTPNKWNRYWQDRAFWTVWRKGAGARHWHGGC
jgi:hypothetical protein